MTSKKLPRTLFSAEVQAPQLPPGDPVRKLMELFSTRTSVVLVRDHLQVIDGAAADAENNQDIEGAKEHAEAIRAYIRELRAALNYDEDDIHRAVAAAIKLTERWMMLRYDAMFAAAVREKEHRLERTPVKVTDEEVRTAWQIVTKQYPNDDEVQQIKHVAGHLGITEKQARARVHRLKLNR